MKKIYFTLFFISVFLFSKAQFVTIPDTAFAGWLRSNAIVGSCMQGSQLDTNCAGVLQLKSINLNKKKVVSLSGITCFKNLDSLTCFQTYVTGLDILPGKLRYLNYSQNYFTLTGLATLPGSLKKIICAQNTLLDSVPLLPAGITYADFTGNIIAALTQPLPPALDTFKLYYNKLQTLPALPQTIVYMDCSGNFLGSLPALPATLKYLNCGSNNISTLPALPSSLEILQCHSDFLTALPDLPASLRQLVCGSNRLTALPTLPSKLFYIQCEANQLTTFPALPDSLQVLNCFTNKIDSIPPLPAGLNRLDCNHNLLNYLPDFPSSLNFLVCSYNKIKSLHPFPANNMVTVQVNNNPDLSCLPPVISLDTIYYGGVNSSTQINISNTNIKCMPNLIKHKGSFPHIDTLPLCSASNPNNCYFTIPTGSTPIVISTDLQVYPNPAHNTLIVSLPSTLKGCTINMVDMLGRPVLHFSVVPEEDFMQTVDVNTLVPGIYLIRTNLATAPIKFVKE